MSAYGCLEPLIGVKSALLYFQNWSLVANKSPIDEVQELQKMVVDYAKQETLDPLKTLGRYIGLGVGGSVMIFLGVSFVGFGVLRFLQTLAPFDSVAEADSIASSQTATWGSTIPYVAAIATLGLALLVIYRGLVRAKESVPISNQNSVRFRTRLMS